MTGRFYPIRDGVSGDTTDRKSMAFPYELISVSDRFVPYSDGLLWQKELHKARMSSLCPDTLLVVEHLPVITLGRGSHPEVDLLRSKEEIERAGIEISEADRGGEISYHAPGQLVCYPILELSEHSGERDLHRYLRNLEQVVIDSLSDFGVDGRRIDGLTGVWAGNEKICAIGIKVSRWVTMHGFALNIDLDLTPMRRDFIPCGIKHLGVTSLREQGLNYKRQEVETAVLSNFERILQRRPTYIKV